MVIVLQLWMTDLHCTPDRLQCMTESVIIVHNQESKGFLVVLVTMITTSVTLLNPTVYIIPE